jgi:ribokinase
VSTPEFDVVVVGSTNLDIVAGTPRLPAPGETVIGHGYAEHPGGKGLNQAVAAARSGARVAFVSAVGADAAGDALVDVMEREGIDTSAVARRDGLPTGRAIIGVSDDGENSIIVVSGANATVIVTTLPTARVVLAQLEVPLETVRASFRVARAMGATTVLNPAPAQTLDTELLQLCDVVVPNEHEAALLGGVGNLIALGAETVVLTQGKDGALVSSAEATTVVEPFAVTPVDTTGAGDTFCGALAARLALGDDQPTALRFAAAAAALSTTRAGAVPSIPVETEVRTFMASAG